MKPKDEVLVSKIELQLAGETVRLTPEQAKRLYAALHEMFGDDASRIVREYVYTRPWWYGAYTGTGTIPCGTGTISTTGMTLSNIGNAISYNADSATLSIAP